MRAIAVPMILLMLSASLAGCAGGDPDGNDESSIDMDILNQMIDDNLQDFINNTSVTVNQEIHYHNNTTVVNNIDETINEGETTNNEFQNTTNVNNEYDFGDGVNGTIQSNDQYYFVRLEWDATDMFPDFFDNDGDRNASFTIINWTYYDYATSQYKTENFDFVCSEYYLFEATSGGNSWGTYWENNDPYYDSWDNQYNDTIAEILQSVAYSNYVRHICDENFVFSGPLADENSGFEYNFLNITIPEGFGISYMQARFEYSSPTQGCGDHTDSDNNSYMCEWYYYEISEGFFHPRNHQDGLYNMEGVYGGWAEINVEFNMHIGYDYDYIWLDSAYRYTLYYQLIPVIQHTE